MKQAAEFLLTLPERQINVIDVGCWTGAVTRDFADMLPGKHIFSIGIDPIRHEPVYKFTHFEEVAIRNAEPAEATLYQYSDPMCNSLLPMQRDITHDPAERDVKWFGAHDFERLLATKTVPVWPLSLVVQKYNLEDAVLHFVKIDAQGCDLSVFLSLGRFIPNCLFVQMETVVSGSEKIVLYEGQMIYEQELPVMLERGFEPFSVTDHRDEGASPEADVVYVNKVLLRQRSVVNENQTVVG